MSYDPKPIDTAGLTLPPQLEELVESLAENNHDQWARQRIADGWTWGEKRDDDLKHHPGLVPYAELSESEKEYDRISSVGTLKAILAQGYRITPPARMAAVAVDRAGEEALPLHRHLFGPHPKRVLALDGGGVKGVLTLSFLERLEDKLAARLVASGQLSDAADFRLCQYFDLIGGTSTGAIIAGALAIGMRASELKRKYLELSRDVFRDDLGLYGVFFEGKRFDQRRLERHLRDVFGEMRLNGPELQTGLCVVTKRADTGSTWPLHNHPDGAYFSHNGPLTLWRVIRASTAAPTFFRPASLPLGDRDPDGQLIKDKNGKMVQGAFVDGAVSMANNPALQCLLLALLKGYRFGWEPGEDRLLLVSVGTGAARMKEDAKAIFRFGVDRWVRHIPEMLMEDAFWQNQLLLQGLSRTPTPWHVDDEVRTGKGELILDAPLTHYVRYDVQLEEKYLREDLGLPDLAKRAPKLRGISDARNVKDLAHIGQTAARVEIPDDPDAFAAHFPARFDHVIR